MKLENKRAELEYMRLEKFLATNTCYPEITPIKIGFVRLCMHWILSHSRSMLN